MKKQLKKRGKSIRKLSYRQFLAYIHLMPMETVSSVSINFKDVRVFWNLSENSRRHCYACSRRIYQNEPKFSYMGGAWNGTRYDHHLCSVCGKKFMDRLVEQYKILLKGLEIEVKV